MNWTTYLPNYTRESVSIYDSEYVTDQTINRASTRLLANDIWLANRYTDLTINIGDISKLWEMYNIFEINSGCWMDACENFKNSGDYLVYSKIGDTPEENTTKNLKAKFGTTTFGLNNEIIPAWSTSLEHFQNNYYGVVFSELFNAAGSTYSNKLIPTVGAVSAAITNIISNSNYVEEIESIFPHSTFQSTDKEMSVAIWNNVKQITDKGIIIKNEQESLNPTSNNANKKLIRENHIKSLIDLIGSSSLGLYNYIASLSAFPLIAGPFQCSTIFNNVGYSSILNLTPWYGATNSSPNPFYIIKNLRIYNKAYVADTILDKSEQKPFNTTTYPILILKPHKDNSTIPLLQDSGVFIGNIPNNTEIVWILIQSTSANYALCISVFKATVVIDTPQNSTIGSLIGIFSRNSNYNLPSWTGFNSMGVSNSDTSPYSWQWIPITIPKVTNNTNNSIFISTLSNAVKTLIASVVFTKNLFSYSITDGAASLYDSSFTKGVKACIPDYASLISYSTNNNVYNGSLFSSNYIGSGDNVQVYTTFSGNDVKGDTLSPYGNYYYHTTILLPYVDNNSKYNIVWIMTNHSDNDYMNFKYRIKFGDVEYSRTSPYTTNNFKDLFYAGSNLFPLLKEVSPNSKVSFTIVENAILKQSLISGTNIIIAHLCRLMPVKVPINESRFIAGGMMNIPANISIDYSQYLG